MQKRIALCVDEAACASPQAIGLDGERLDAQEWLDVHVNGADARDALKDDEDVGEVWVASCDDVEAINLAAALKVDRPELVVRLVGFDAGGSLMSRAHSASIDEVMGRTAFVERYNREKVRARGIEVASEALPATAVPAVAGSEGLGLPETTALALAGLAPFPTAAHGRGFILPVVSGSGGAGKSSVAVLGAFAAHALGHKTLLLDYDLQFGDAAALAGADAAPALDEVLSRPGCLDGELAQEARPAVIAAPRRLETAEAFAHAVPELLDFVAPQFDVIVANTGASWAEQHAALLERSTAAIFLVDQRSSSVRACRHALELCARCGIATGQFQFALNRCAKNAPLSSIDVSCALNGAKVAELKDGGRDVEEYLAAGAAAELAATGNDFATSVRKLVADLVSPAGFEEKGATAGPRAKTTLRRRGRHVGKRKGWGK